MDNNEADADAFRRSVHERSTTTPPVFTFFTTFQVDPVALGVIVALAAGYTVGLVLARRAGVKWPLLRTLAFFGLGLGSYAWVSFGFLGAYSTELRWAFTTRIALLLFAVPGLIALGQPVELARAALSGWPLRVIDRVMNSWLVKLLGNAMFAGLLALSAFLIFLTPFALLLRQSPFAESLITVLVPLVGLIMVLPIIGLSVVRTSLFITVEFLFAFVELVMDAIPGILLRLNDSVLDGARAVAVGMPSWFPNPLHDQHLSGDFLWFIAEIADIPVLIILFMRWIRVDRGEAKQMDDLTDDEMEALTREHLRGYHGQ
ncbi:MAG: cytochrome c oxidase assembly protein [Microbacteriaceae bacterium]